MDSPDSLLPFVEFDQLNSSDSSVPGVNFDDLENSNSSWTSIPCPDFESIASGQEHCLPLTSTPNVTGASCPKRKLDFCHCKTI